MYKKILVPVDGSEKAAKAAMHAAKLASEQNAEITLFHVVYDLPQFSYNSPIIIEELHRQGLEIIETLRKLPDLNDRVFDYEIVVGQPADEICKKAKDGGYDLLVMGNRGLGEIKGYLMGSVSNRVIRHAVCPVLIVR